MMDSNQGLDIYGADVKVKIALAEILLMVNSFYEHGNAQVSIFDNEKFRKIKPVLKYIQMHPEGDLSLEALSRKFFIDRYYLISLFKKATGFTVTDYIIRYRVIRACEILRKGLTVQEAGELSGFNNNSHFIRTFKQISGLSPGKYAKRFKNR